jgi:hypothetical protein
MRYATRVSGRQRDRVLHGERPALGLRGGLEDLGDGGRGMDGEADGLGERLVRRYLALWEHPEHGSRLHAILNSAASSPAAAAMLKEFLTNEVLQPLAKQLGAGNAETRGILAGSQLIGLAFTRYVLKVGPLTSLDQDERVACVAPAIQRYLTGDLPLA